MSTCGASRWMRARADVSIALFLDLLFTGGVRSTTISQAVETRPVPGRIAFGGVSEPHRRSLKSSDAILRRAPASRLR